MIVCPNCKADIDDDSIYCDQCGEILSFCTKCGRVGIGKRCSHCGAPMAYRQQALAGNEDVGQSLSVSDTLTTVGGEITRGTRIPSITLGNVALGINIVGIDDAIIGRREGPYVTLFQTNRYVSGRHAQLHYDKMKGWTIIDKHSSNGTFVNGTRLAPEEAIALSDGDTLVIANVSLKVKIG